MFVIFVTKKIEDQYAKNNKYHKVRDHCLYTGKYRGAAESTCKIILSKEIPIVFITD